MEIEPGTTIPLVYQNVTYVTDPTLYYVRAVIRDSITGTTLDTKNLTHRGNGRYTSSFNAPTDGSGTGRHVDITITVYTDDLYTIKSPDYQERNSSLLIRAARILGGGGSGVDYDSIQKIVSDLLDIKIQPVKFPNMLQLKDLSGIVKRLNLINSTISEIDQKIKPQEEVNFSPLEEKINEGFSLLKGEIKKEDQKIISNIINLLTQIDNIEILLKQTDKENIKNKEEILNSFQEQFKEYLDRANKIKVNLEKTLSVTDIEKVLKENLDGITKIKMNLENEFGIQPPPPPLEKTPLVSKYFQ